MTVARRTSHSQGPCRGHRPGMAICPRARTLIGRMNGATMGGWSGPRGVVAVLKLNDLKSIRIGTSASLDAWQSGQRTNLGWNRSEPRQRMAQSMAPARLYRAWKDCRVPRDGSFRRAGRVERTPRPSTQWKPICATGLRHRRKSIAGSWRNCCARTGGCSWKICRSARWRAKIARNRGAITAAACGSWRGVDAQPPDREAAIVSGIRAAHYAGVLLVRSRERVGRGGKHNAPLRGLWPSVRSGP